MMRVALTGGIASGKSTVADLLAGHGAVIIDADVLAREVVAPGTPGLEQVCRRFGGQLRTAAGSLDRKALGSIVFSDPTARSDLEAIIHPLVRQRAAAAERTARKEDPDAVVIQVIPLLVETGQASQFDVVVVVDVEPQIQLQRLMQRDQLTPADALARIDAQASRKDRLAAADIVIQNNDSPPSLASQVDRLWAQLSQS